MAHAARRYEYRQAEDRAWVVFICPACAELHFYPVKDERPGQHGLFWNGDIVKPSGEGFTNEWRDLAGDFHRCHFRLINGRICFASDSTHRFGGRWLDVAARM